jgi:hypothetical protein
MAMKAATSETHFRRQLSRDATPRHQSLLQFGVSKAFSAMLDAAETK